MNAEILQGLIHSDTSYLLLHVFEYFSLLDMSAISDGKNASRQSAEVMKCQAHIAKSKNSNLTWSFKLSVFLRP